MSKFEVGHEVRDPSGHIGTVAAISGECVTVCFSGNLHVTYRAYQITAAHSLKVKRLFPDATLPKYQTAGAAAFDLPAYPGTSDGYYGQGDLLMNPGDRLSIGTGLAFDIPAGHVLYVTGRSGLAFRQSIFAAHAIGVIDSDYRGEVRILLENRGETTARIAHGDRIAQAMLIKCPQVELIEVDELSETERGTSGYGSTGK